MKTIAITFSFCLILLSSCDPLQDEYFSPLLGLNKVDLHRKCADNELSILSEGKAVEKYQLSETTYTKFTNKFSSHENQINIPEPNQYSRKFESILTWKKTPIAKEDSLLLNLPNALFERKKCLDRTQLYNLLKTEGNFYAAYNNPPGFEYFVLFIINGESKSLYVLQNTW